MKTGLVSEKRAKALGLLKDELAIEDFVGKMWGGSVAVKFAHHFLSGLIKLGYVEKKEERNTEFYKATGEGAEAVARMRCNYCGAKRWKVKLVTVSCRACEKEHWCCPKCSGANLVVVGEFPKYRPALRQCPKA